MSLSTTFRTSILRRARVATTAATALLSATLLTLLAGGTARAQTYADPPNKPSLAPAASPIIRQPEKQSPVNPYPNGGGNAQNRSWAAGDMLWGVMDFDVPWYEPPLARVSTANRLIAFDGWTYPRVSDYYDMLGAQLPITDPNYNGNNSTATIVATAFADGELPSGAAPAPVSGTTFAPAGVSPTTGLGSTNIVSKDAGGNPDYYEALAFPRPASTALSYNANDKFVWRLDNPVPAVTATLPTITIPGAAGTQNRYQILVHVPTPQAPIATILFGGLQNPENRVDDARYTVYYYIKVGTTYQPRQLVCSLVAQTSGGDYQLVATDGTIPVFPMFSSASFTAKGVATIPGVTLPAQPTFADGAGAPGTPTVATPILQGVALDNTTGDSGLGEVQFVLADSITLTPTTAIASATPTITPPHGGRLTPVTGTGATSIPTLPKTYLPDSPDAAYNATATANIPHMADPNNVFGDTTGIFSYANDINDPQYATNYGAYTPWDVSTYFMGPRSLIDPRYIGTDRNGNVFAAPGAQVGPIDPYVSDRPTLNIYVNPADLTQTVSRAGASVDATNNGVYGTVDASGVTHPAPYFSHAQVIVAKTEFVQDPETGVSAASRTGVKTVQVGEIYALDWQTGAPVWRFPDRTYLPLGATLNGKEIIGAGLRNQQIGTDPIQKAPVFLIPGIVAIDRNGDGVISDDEVFLGTSQIVNVGGSAATPGGTVAGGTNYTITAGLNATNGAASASVTIAPRVLVQGDVQIPVHDSTWTPTNMVAAGVPSPTDITSATLAKPGRYYVPGTNNFEPVPVGMAFIAAGNGVMYAVDAYGNNDTRYFPGTTIPTTAGGHYNGGTYFGTYQPGTTNVFWSFSNTNHSQQPAENGKDAETTFTYDQRVMGEVPGTSSFASSAPVLAWNLTDSEMAQATPPATPELRLFVGNTNGVLYAMDPTAKAGYRTMKDPMTGAIINIGVQSLPYIKGGQTDVANYYGAATVQAVNGTNDLGNSYQSELKWWYRTQGGAINYSPAVSLYRHDQTSIGNGQIEKGVYISSAEGRVYCVDWDGPSDLSNNLARLALFDGTSNTAGGFNNDYYFHNTMPAFNNGVADNQQGHVRPRWTYPNLYRTNTPTDVNNKLSAKADTGIASGLSGALLAEPSSLGPIQTAPVLMDFWWQDPDTTNAVPTLMSYVAFVANDTSGAEAITSRVYLLDQIGDRVDFLTNPRVSGTGSAARAISQPRDRYNPQHLLSSIDPTIPTGLAWTYRYQYDAYPTTAGAPTVQDAAAVQLRNMPLFDQITGTGGLTVNISANSFDPFVVQTLPAQYYGGPIFGQTTATPYTAYIHQPSRRMLPTLFAGGAAEVYGLDIDPETGVFMRWRPTVGEQSLFTVLNSRMLQGIDPYPGDPTTTGTMSTLDQLAPLDHVFDTATATAGFGYARSALGTQEIFARVTHLDGDLSKVTAITVTGGPTQNRSNLILENGAAAPAEPTVPSQPTNDLPNLMQFQTGIATVIPSGQIGGGGTVTHGNGATTVTVDANGLPSHTATGGNTTGLPLGGHLTNAVNQDINDPVTTTAGRIGSNQTASPTLTAIHNAAFQAPILIVSTLGAANSYIHGLSTNIEGEDRVSPLISAATNVANFGAAGDSHLIGWSIASPGDESRANNRGHTNLFTIEGPGGTAGAAVFANAYFPATDPYATSYRNTVASSLSANPNSDLDEPNTFAPTPQGPGGLIDVDDPTHPRPDFKPRPYVFNQPSNTSTTPSPDAHTGLSGFPLSLNGLFFDRQYAGAGATPGTAATQFPALRMLNSNPTTKYVGGTFGYSATGNYNNDNQHPLGDYHVWPRLPGYSNIGTQLANTATNTYNGTTYNYFDINNQSPDGVRIMDIDGNPTGVDVRIPALPVGAKTGAGDQLSDDINPAGQDVAWFYTGSSNGVVYAYTPAIVGHDTGLEGGNILFGAGTTGGGGGGNYSSTPPGGPGGNGTNPRVGIYTQDQLNAILGGLIGAGNTPIARDVSAGFPLTKTWPKLSIAAENGKNYYEWGETVYILVYDLLAQPYTVNQSRFQRFIPTIPVNSGIPQGGVDQSVHVTVSTISGNTVNNPIISLEGVNYAANGDGRLLEYYYDNTTGQFEIYDPAATGATAPSPNSVPLGVAVYKYVLGANPSNSNTQTPGALLAVHVTQQSQGSTTASAFPGTGDEPGTVNNPDSYFSIANPLAVQGFLTASVGNSTVTVNPSAVAGEYHNGNLAGPFEASADQFPGANPKQDDRVDQDPSQTGSEYWQALTNGNTIRRIDTRVFITKTDSASGTVYQQPQQPGQPIRVNGQGVEPAFYLPVATSTGYINPATSGSTSVGAGNNNQRLRLMNRSLVTTALPKVRVAPIDSPSDFQFRAWPGKVMNADTDADYPTVAGALNPRITPPGMDAPGRINPLPWETIPAEARPWSPATYANNSPDYPDVPGRRKNALQILSPSGDLTTTPGSLPGNTSHEALDESDAVSANVTMPAFQPANLVAAQELTSTYYAANPLDYATAGALGVGVTLPSSVAPGPLQLPRGVNNRLLSYNGKQVVTPFGYTARVVAYIDSDGTQRLNPATTANRVSGGNLGGIQSANQASKANREFEVWAGVPVDQSLKVVESVIDLGALAHGFAEQNGLLGYNIGATDASGIGLTPLNPAYSGYFKTFTVQNTGNVNDYNARSSQRTESPIVGDGTGSSYSYFLLHSPTVDPRFGLLAVGSDPALPGIGTKLAADVMPQIVTSLDPILDTLWDSATKTYLEGVLGKTPGDALYTTVYAPFGGRHAIPKALPNSASASVLGIPAQPVASSLVSGIQLASVPPAVAVALPLGTPVGVYSSNLGSTPFTIFEDHDTPNYNPLPYVTSGGMSLAPTITPAGPLYHGQNLAPPGTSPIYSGGTATMGEGIWRAQTAAQGTYGNPNYVPPTFLPYAYPYLTIKAAVTENGLTGQFPDLATATVPSINTGVLPSIDPFPVVTTDTKTNTATTIYRPSAALTPAAWRDSNGVMHIYYSRNDTSTNGAMPGAPYALYHSSLDWDNTIGVWKANATGTPVAAPGSAAGHWLKSPIVINSSATDSSTSPFVLTYTTSGTGSTGPIVNVGAATLFFTDSAVNPNGSTHNRIFFTDVTSNGDGGTATEYFTNADPSFARYAPRVAFAATNSNGVDGIDELMYYGGAPGRWAIYYVPRTASKGLPNGIVPDASATQGVEKTLAMPSAIVSSSEPSPVYRKISDDKGNPIDVVDVYFTGISKTTQTPDIYMTRYTVAADGTLALKTLPSVTTASPERLASIGRNGVWRAASLNWVASPAAPPTITWKYNGTNLTTAAGNWKLDPSTGILYQAVGGTPTTLTYVYVDAAAGTVQFRGASAPQVTDSVTAAYTPQTYRLTSDGASNFGDFTFLDPQTLPATPTGQGNVIRRQKPLLSGRDYLLWQKGAASGKSPTLYYSVRRVGIDLQIPTGYSILLGQADGNKDQTPLAGPITIDGVNNIPFDVDFINGRVYIEPQWEGQPVTIAYTLIAKGAQGPNATTPASTTKTITAQYLDELNVGAQGNFGAALPVTAGINEGQAAAFIDLYDWVGLGKSRTDPPAVSTSGAYDPTLTPGRTWIFWTSPRGRTGQTAVPDPYPAGFNLYWETIAPNFEGSAIYSYTSHS